MDSPLVEPIYYPVFLFQEFNNVTPMVSKQGGLQFMAKPSTPSIPEVITNRFGSPLQQNFVRDCKLLTVLCSGIGTINL